MKNGAGNDQTEKYGEGNEKFILAVFGIATAAVNLVIKADTLTDREHSLLATMILAMFVLYVLMDIARWGKEYFVVWILGTPAILVACYWWIGFMAKHGIPKDPLLPVNFYPHDWVFVAAALLLSGYCFHDLKDAWDWDYEDKTRVMAATLILVLGIVICLFLTLRGPIS